MMTSRFKTWVAKWQKTRDSIQDAVTAIECRAPASGPPRDPLVFLRRDFFVTLNTIATFASSLSCVL